MSFTYPIRCTGKGCARPAEYKIAARWTDGITEELKTYGLTCADHLAEVYRQSLNRQRSYQFAPGELLDPPGIYRCEPGRRDDQLQRLADLETQISQETPNPS